jgi:release factor glutamine methyltransferase
MAGGSERMWTVLRLLNWTRDFFVRRGLSDARVSAEILLAHSLGCRRIELYTRFDYQPTHEERTRYRDLVRRAARHEPVAYLVGEKEFYSLRFKVTGDVLIPRPESEVLVSEAIEYLQTLARRPRLWDVCTGSGCVAIAAAVNLPALVALGTDISPGAVAVGAENAQTHGVADRVRFRVADLLTLPDDCADMGRVDVITANPPYVAADEDVAKSVEHEPAIAVWAGPDGLKCIEPIVRDAPRFLAPGGRLIMEFGFAQVDVVRDLVIECGAFAEPRMLRDHQDIERVVVAERRG